MIEHHQQEQRHSQHVGKDGQLYVCHHAVGINIILIIIKIIKAASSIFRVQVPRLVEPYIQRQATIVASDALQFSSVWTFPPPLCSSLDGSEDDVSQIWWRFNKIWRRSNKKKMSLLLLTSKWHWQNLVHSFTVLKLPTKFCVNAQSCCWDITSLPICQLRCQIIGPLQINRLE